MREVMHWENHDPRAKLDQHLYSVGQWQESSSRTVNLVSL